MALANNPFTDRDYRDWRESQFAHGAEIGKQAGEYQRDLNAMVERMRAENAERTAQIAANVGMANIEAHKPLFEAQASAINEMLPLKKKRGEQEIAMGDIEERLAKMQLEAEPEFLQKKLNQFKLGEAGYKTNILSAIKHGLEGYEKLKGGKSPSYLNELFGIKDELSPPEPKIIPPEESANVAKPKNSGFLTTLSYGIPALTAGIGAAVGAPFGGIGGIAGGAAGGIGGEYLRQYIMGEDIKHVPALMSGIGGGASGKLVARPLTKAALSTPWLKNRDFLYRIGANL